MVSRRPQAAQERRATKIEMMRFIDELSALIDVYLLNNRTITFSTIVNTTDTRIEVVTGK